MTVALFDPSVVSANLGDQIIRDSVINVIEEIYPKEQILSIPTQEKIGRISVRHAMHATQRFVGGTNLLSSHMLRYRQWQIGLRQAGSLRDVTLLGVGWWQYQERPDAYTRLILRSVLSKKLIHSVRDGYTHKKLASIGMDNAINTGCPTMWSLTPDHCQMIPKDKASKVVFTLTDYHSSDESDRGLIELLKRRYEEVYFWPQGSGDLKHLRSIGSEGVQLLAPSLAAYDRFLSTADSVDFVGTRLHGGVRALQKRRRALILAVDNRAREISADTGLSVVDRIDIDAVSAWIDAKQETRISLNWQGIEQWKKQFHVGQA